MHSIQLLFCLTFIFSSELINSEVQGKVIGNDTLPQVSRDFLEDEINRLFDLHVDINFLPLVQTIIEVRIG